MLDRLHQFGMRTLGTPQAATVTLITLLAANACLRLWVLPQALGFDDAEQVLSAQRWALIYRFEQPPLVTWLIKLVALPVGGRVGLEVLTLARSLMLAALYLCTYLAARHWLGDHVRSVVAASALATTYTLGWLAHGDLPHSTLLATLVALALWLWGRLLARPTLARTLAFAAACGLGLLAKWNFVMLVAGFVVIALLRPTTRQLVLSWRALLVGLVMALMAGPSALAVLADHPSFTELTGSVLAPNAPPAAGSGIALGLVDLALAALAFPQPWLILALLVLWPARQPSTAASADLALLIVVVLALHAVLVSLAGVSDIPERWMIVPLLPLPILVLSLVAPEHPRVYALGGAAVGLAVVVLLLRGGIGLTDAAYCGKCRPRIPVSAFAEGLREQGFARGTIVVEDMHLGGNLANVMPDARVVALSFPERAWPDAGDGQCAIAWTGPATRGERLAARAEARLGASLAGRPTVEVEAALIGSDVRTQTMRFRVGRGAGRCR